MRRPVIRTQQLIPGYPLPRQPAAWAALAADLQVAPQEDRAPAPRERVAPLEVKVQQVLALGVAQAVEARLEVVLDQARAPRQLPRWGEVS